MATTRRPQQRTRRPRFEVQKVVGQFWRDDCRLVVGRVVNVRGRLCGDVRVFAGAGTEAADPAGLCFGRENLIQLRELVAALVQAVEALADDGKTPTQEQGEASLSEAPRSEP